MAKKRETIRLRDVTEADARVGEALSKLPLEERVRVLRRSLQRLENECDMDPKNLDARFERQLRLLRSRGVNMHLVSAFRSQKTFVLGIAGEIELTSEMVPFLPVIPFRFLCLHAQAAMVPKLASGDRYAFDPSGLADRPGMSESLRPYYVFGVTMDSFGTNRAWTRRLGVGEALALAIQGYAHEPLVTTATVGTSGNESYAVVIPDASRAYAIELWQRLDDPTALIPHCLESV